MKPLSLSASLARFFPFQQPSIPSSLNLSSSSPSLSLPYPEFLSLTRSMSSLSLPDRSHPTVTSRRPAGEIHVNVGPMFAGKTTALLRLSTHGVRRNAQTMSLFFPLSLFITVTWTSLVGINIWLPAELSVRRIPYISVVGRETWCNLVNCEFCTLPPNIIPKKLEKDVCYFLYS